MSSAAARVERRNDDGWAPVGHQRVSPAEVSGAIVALLERRSQMTSAFQPIFALRDDSVLGYEALLRLPEDSGFREAAEVFAAAVGTHWLVDLEVAALDTHLAAAWQLPPGRLFLNFSAPAFFDNRMKAAALTARVRAAGLVPERVVLELTELVRVPDPARFVAAVEPLREEGFRLAVDDFGSGFTNLRMLVELGPDFVKVDRALVAGAGRHPRKRVFLESIGVLGRRINCAVVAEGVETPEDVATLRACGIPYAQGHALVPPSTVAALRALPPARGLSTLAVSSEEPIGALTIPQDGVPPTIPVGLVLPLFDHRPEPVAIPVLDGTRVAGLLTVGLLFLHLGHRYGHALWHDRPVAEFLMIEGEGHDCLPAHASLEDATEVVRSRPSRRRFDPIVVLNDRGDYHGLLPVDLLLGEMTRLKVDYALQANPLTGLPGSVALTRAAEMRLAAGLHFTLGWADIDHFKPFNDRYGFSRGDEVLLLLAEILRRHLGARPDDFLAHPGGDDFAFLVLPDDAERRAWDAALEFSRRVPDLYDLADRAAGGINSADRHGNELRFGFLSLSIGLVAWRGETRVDLRALFEVAAEVKAVAKAQPGPAAVTNARALATLAQTRDG